MPDYRFSASASKSRGELHVTPDGISFIPSAVERGGQLKMDLRGWFFDWDQVDGIERVSAGKIQSRDVGGGALRIHYAGFRRFVTVQIHEQLDPVLAVLDSHAA